MAGFRERVRLGRSEMEACPLGVSGGYGVGKAALLAAFDRGVNYFYHGSRRAPGMTAAIRDLVAGGHREELVVVLQSYSRSAWLMERTLTRGLGELGIEHADVLLLGWYNALPAPRILERALRLREAGAARHLAVSGHRRPAFADFAADHRFDVLHLRYNAAHTGAEEQVFPYLDAVARPGVVVYTATRWGTLLDPRRMPSGERPLRGRDAYRFVLSNPHVDVCMCGPRNDAEMTEALAALDDGPLGDEEMRRIRSIGTYIHTHRSLLAR